MVEVFVRLKLKLLDFLAIGFRLNLLGVMKMGLWQTCNNGSNFQPSEMTLFSNNSVIKIDSSTRLIVKGNKIIMGVIY